MCTGVTLSAHLCKWVIANASETGILALARILMACKCSQYDKIVYNVIMTVHFVCLTVFDIES